MITYEVAYKWFNTIIREKFENKREAFECYYDYKNYTDIEVKFYEVREIINVDDLVDIDDDDFEEHVIYDEY